MVFHRSIVNWSGRVHVSSVYVHSVICVDLCGVTLFHRCVVNWSEGVYIFSVYVYSAIFESYLV